MGIMGCAARVHGRGSAGRPIELDATFNHATGSALHDVALVASPGRLLVVRPGPEPPQPLPTPTHRPSPLPPCLHPSNLHPYLEAPGTTHQPPASTTASNASLKNEYCCWWSAEAAPKGV